MRNLHSIRIIAVDHGYEYNPDLMRLYIVKSHSNAAIDALNDYFDRYYKVQDDPYLETRERETQFIERIMTAIEASLNRTLPAYWNERIPQTTPTTENKHQPNPEAASTPDVD